MSPSVGRDRLTRRPRRRKIRSVGREAVSAYPSRKEPEWIHVEKKTRKSVAANFALLKGKVEVEDTYKPKTPKLGRNKKLS